jgi:transcriptional regulator with XRE-family HTH domain
MNSPLRSLREARCLTQRELARQAGVHTVTISKMETHDYDFWSVKTTCRLADVLGVTADVLLGREPPPPAPVDALARADRVLLDAMERAANDFIGPSHVHRAGGWRRIALSMWQGKLIGARDRDLPRPPRPLLAAVQTIADQEKRHRQTTKARAAR